MKRRKMSKNEQMHILRAFVNELLVMGGTEFVQFKTVIEGMEEFARQGQFDPDGPEVMDFFIRGLSREHHFYNCNRIDIDYLVDRVRQRFQEQAQLRYIDEYKDLVDRGEVDKAAALTLPQANFGDTQLEAITGSGSKMKRTKRSIHEEVRDWVREQLEGGWALSNDLLEQGKEQGYPKNRIYQALHEIGARSENSSSGNHKWSWYLPDKEADQEAAKRKPAYTRALALHDALKNTGETGFTQKELAISLDELYVKQGGKSSPSGSKAMVDHHLPVLVVFGIVEKQEDRLYRLKKDYVLGER